MRSIKSFLLLSIAVLVCNIVCGKSVHYVSILNDNDISCIDEYDGILWVGTGNGFYVEKNSVLTKCSYVFLPDGPLSFAGVQNIVAYGKKALISTPEFSLCYDSESGQSTGPLHYLSNLLIPSAVVGTGSAAYIFVESFCSLFKYDFVSGTVSLVKTLGEPFDYHFIRGIHIPGTKSSMYLFDRIGNIYSFNAETGELYKMNGGPDYFAMNASAVDYDGSLWLASNDLGVLHYSCNNEKHTLSLIESFNTGNSSISSNRIRCILPAESEIYVSTAESGLNIISRNSTGAAQLEVRSNEFVRYLSMLYETSRGNMLCVTEDKGLILMKESFISSLSYSTLDYKKKLGDKNVLSLFSDSSANSLWIGTEHGINRYDYATGLIYRPEHVRQPAVLSMAAYDKNHFLVVCRNLGFMLFDKRTGGYSRFKSDLLTSLNNANHDYSNITLSNIASGEILITGFSSTNYLLDPKTNVTKNFDFAFAERDEWVIPILNPNPDQVLFKSNSSIYELETSTMETRRLYKCDSLMSGVAVSGNNIMFAIRNRIYTFVPSVNELEEFMTVDMFDDISLVDMKFSEDNILWTVDNQGGLYYIDIKTKVITKVPTDLYKSSKFIPYPSLQAINNSVVFVGTSGVVVVHSDEMGQNSFDNPSLKLNSVYLNDSVLIEYQNEYQNEYKNEYKGECVQVPSTYKSVKCNFVLDDSKNFDGVSIRYSLSKKNRNIDLRNTKESCYEFRNFGAGKYVLMASVLQSHGWTEPVEVIELQVMRSAFVSILAICIYVFVALFCIVLILCLIVKSNNSKKYIELSKMDQDSDAAKIRFMTHLAHDIRSPLSLVYNPLRDIRDDNRDNPQLYKKITRALAQVNKASRLATTVMNIQKLTQTEDMVQLVNLNLNEWLATLMLEFNIDCEARGLKLEFESESRIQSIKTDLTKVEVAVSNMLQNAIQSNNSGTIKVSTSFPSQRYIRISVADEGAGFVGDGESLFAINPNSLEGFGVGLAYARKIVNKMNGRLFAEHNPTGGTTLILDIPLLMSYAVNHPSESAAVAASSVQQQQSDSDFSVNSKKMVLLIVDDQQDVLDFIKEELEDKFKKIVTAHNGIEALVQIDYYHPDAIVSDIMMPQMNGFELCQSLKTNVKISHLPIIALSSKTEAANQITFFKNGPDDFIGKPFDVNHLYSVVVSHMTKRAQIKENYNNGTLKELTTQNSFSAADDKFIVKLQEILSKSNTAEGVNISDLGNAFNLSSKEVSLKMESLVGVDFSKYVKNYYANEK